MISPGGSAYVGVAIDARHTHALAKNGVLPNGVLAVDRRSGIPRRAIAVNVLVILAFLLPLGGWQDVVSAVGDLYLLTYGAAAVAAGVFAVETEQHGWLRHITWVAPVSFVVATLFVYWSGWHDLRVALSLTLIGVPLYFIAWRRAPRAVMWELARSGAWVVGYIRLVLLVSWLGSFTDGIDKIDSPWDTILIGVIAAGTYLVAVRSGRRFRAAHPDGVTAIAIPCSESQPLRHPLLGGLSSHRPLVASASRLRQRARRQPRRHAPVTPPPRAACLWSASPAIRDLLLTIANIKRAAPPGSTPHSG
ncbi:MAG: hypothetical protein WAN22_19735 [Solirubrobacteraceae bacterium]